jgi:hypothetical protein
MASRSDDPKEDGALMFNVNSPLGDLSVQRKKGLELQRQWGDKPCAHPAFSREYDAGERTGNYRCTQCGASMTFREKAEITTARKE